MTLPFERTRAMLDVRLFLLELTDPGLTLRLPRSLRGKAASLLKHFPTNADIEQAHQALPGCFGPVPPFRIRAELAAEAAPKNKLLAGIRDTTEAGKGGACLTSRPMAHLREQERMDMEPVMTPDEAERAFMTARSRCEQ